MNGAFDRMIDGALRAFLTGALDDSAERGRHVCHEAMIEAWGPMTEDQRHRPRSEADRAFMEAIELGVQERSPYPFGAVFIDAEQEGAGVGIARAAAEGKPVVLCSRDGTRQILHASSPAAA